MANNTRRRPSVVGVGFLAAVTLLLSAPAVSAQAPAPEAPDPVATHTVSVVEQLGVNLGGGDVATDAVPGNDANGGTTPPDTDQRSTTSRTDVEDFRMIGVTVASTDEAAGARIRMHGDSGWREWMDLEWEGQVGPDQGTAEADRAAEGGDRLSSSPIWVDNADGFEVDLPSSTDDARVLLVRDEAVDGAAVPQPETNASLPGRNQPPIGLRSSWGARPPRVQPEIAPRVQIAVVHHTVSENGYPQSAVPSLLRSVQAFHMDGNGWDDIGYNFLVDAYGGIWEGRAGGTTNAVIGAHAIGANAFGTGVSVIGNFDVAAPPAAVTSSLGQIIGWKLYVHGVDARSRVDFNLGEGALGGGQVRNFPAIIGHRDVALTACPGQYLYGQLDGVRAWAGSYQDNMRSSQGFWSSITIGTNQDGRLELFSIGLDGAIYHNWQVYGGWSGWHVLGGRFAGRLTVANNADGRLEVFGITVSGRLAHSWQTTPNGGWSGFKEEGGTWSPDTGVAVARGGSGRLEAVVMGNDQAWVFWQIAPNSSWDGAAPLGGSFPSFANVTMGVNQDGRLEVFAVADGGVLVHAWQRSLGGGWSGFASFGMPASGKPSVANNADGRLEVVGVDNAGNMWQVWQKTPNGTWAGPKVLSGGFMPDADAKLARNQDGRLQAFSLDWAGGLSSAWQQTTGSIWTPTRGFGGRLMGTLDVALGADGRMALASFTWPYADRAWMLTQNAPNGDWGVWAPIL